MVVIVPPIILAELAGLNANEPATPRVSGASPTRSRFSKMSLSRSVYQRRPAQGGGSWDIAGTVYMPPNMLVRSSAP